MHTVQPASATGAARGRVQRLHRGFFDDATGPTATHTFDAAGDHTVGLSVTGPGGTSTTNKAISVALPPPPVASFAAVPTSGVAPLTVTFADTSTGDITARSWDFDGDGNGDAAGEAASHVFEAAGSYLVALTVTGPGGSNTTSQTITVNVPPPVASFTAAPITGTAPLSVQFTNTSTGNITSMTWTLGNGTGFVDDTLPFDEPVQTTYDAPATYTATLTVSGPGGSDTASQSVTVNAPNTAPTLEIAAPANGASFPALTNVTFTGTANDSEDGNISSSIQWSSSIDGVLGTGASISEGELSSGTHTITASVSDSDGAPATAQITITITTPATTTTTTQPPPTLPDPPDECFPRRCEPRDPGDDPPDRR